VPLSSAFWAVFEVAICYLVFCAVFALLGRSRTESYFRQNPGSAFIIAFLSCIVTGGLAVGLGDESVADSIMTHGFYLVVVGLGLQGLEAVWHRRRSKAA
jgi:bacteriorhodopsin